MGFAISKDGASQRAVNSQDDVLPDEVYSEMAVTIVAPVIVPTIVTMRQARLALLKAGLLTQVNTAVANADDAAKITWEFSSEVRRDDPLVTQLAAALNLNSSQLDQLFTVAGGL